MANTNEEITNLQIAITDMDCFSQEGFSKIATIARLTIKALESGACVNPMDDVINVLRVIWSKADDVQNLINCEAEDVGCNYRREAINPEANSHEQ